MASDSSPQAIPSNVPASVARRAQDMGWFALSGFGAYVFLIIVCHFMRRDLSPLRHVLSDFGVGSSQVLFTGASICLGLGVLALASGLFCGLPRGGQPRAAAILLGLSGLAFFGTAAFPIDLPGAQATLFGALHLLFDRIAGILWIVSGLIFARRFDWNPGWRHLWLPTVAVIAFRVTAGDILQRGLPLGLVQRGLWGMTLALYIVFALHLIRGGRGGRRARSS